MFLSRFITGKRKRFDSKLFLDVCYVEVDNIIKNI